MLQQRFSCSMKERPQWSRCFTAVSGGVHGGPGIHPAAHGRSHAVTGGYFLSETAAGGEPTLEQICSEGLQPMGRTQNGEGKSVNKKEQQGGTVTNWPHPHSLCAARGVGEDADELGVK